MNENATIVLSISSIEFVIYSIVEVFIFDNSSFLEKFGVFLLKQIKNMALLFATFWKWVYYCSYKMSGLFLN